MTYTIFVDAPTDTLWKMQYALFVPYTEKMRVYSIGFDEFEQVAKIMSDEYNENVENRLIFCIFYKDTPAHTPQARLKRYRIATAMDSINRSFSYIKDQESLYIVAIDQLELDSSNAYSDPIKKVALELDEKGYIANALPSALATPLSPYLLLKDVVHGVDEVWEKEIKKRRKKELSKDAFKKLLCSDVAVKMTQLLTSELQHKEITKTEEILQEFQEYLFQTIENTNINANNMRNFKDQLLESVIPSRIVYGIIAKHCSALKNHIRYPLFYYKNDKGFKDRHYTEILSFIAMLHLDQEKKLHILESFWLKIDSITLENQDMSYSKLYRYLKNQQTMLNKKKSLLQQDVSKASQTNAIDQIIPQPPVMNPTNALSTSYFYNDAERERLAEKIDEYLQILKKNKETVNHYIGDIYVGFKNKIEERPMEVESLTRQKIDQKIKEMESERSVDDGLSSQIGSGFAVEYRQYKNEKPLAEQKIINYFKLLPRAQTLLVTFMALVLLMLGMSVLSSLPEITKMEIVPSLGLLGICLVGAYLALVLKYVFPYKDAYNQYYKKTIEINRMMDEQVHAYRKVIGNILRKRVQSDYLNRLKEARDILEIESAQHQYHIDKITEKLDYIQNKDREGYINLDKTLSPTVVQEYSNVETTKSAQSNATYAIFSFNGATTATAINLAGVEYQLHNDGFIETVEIKAEKTL